MNIVITLPKVLISKIKEGTKNIEVRPSIPKMFDKEKDVVYVVEKGTKSCPIALVIENFELITNTDYAYRKYGKELGVPYLWFHMYAKTKKRLYFWHIGGVVIFGKELSMTDDLHVQRTPQALVYSPTNILDVMKL